MARFEDFTQHEKRVIREAMTWAQSEFYDPGHTKEDRDTLGALIREIEDADLPFTFGTAAADMLVVGTPASTKGQAITVTSNTKPVVVRVTAGKPAEPAQRDRREPWTPPEVSAPTRPQTTPRGPAEATAGHTGFLFIECAHCGDIHAFYTKQPIMIYRCNECGGRTPLTDMHRLRVMCECGAKYNYLTNIVTRQMDVNCFKCGCPVAVEWVERRERYEPIGWTATRKGGRKK